LNLLQFIAINFFLDRGNIGCPPFTKENLILAAAGRIKAAIKRKQLNFDEMELSHQKI